eukprot:Pgem_evm1s8482
MVINSYPSYPSSSRLLSMVIALYPPSALHSKAYSKQIAMGLDFIKQILAFDSYEQAMETLSHYHIGN